MLCLINDLRQNTHPYRRRRFALDDPSAALVVAHVDDRIRHVARVYTMVVTFLPA